MGLNLATNQCLTAPVSISAPQPFTFMCWAQKSAVYFTTQALLSLADASEELAYNNIQAHNDWTRAISFSGYAEATDTSHFIDDGTPHFLCAVFGASTITFYFDDETPVSVAWSPSGSVAFDLLAIGRNANSAAGEFFSGTLEHVAVWSAALTSTQVGGLRATTTKPDDISGLIAWLPLKDSLTDEVGTLTWTATNLSTPSYSDLGVEYGSQTYTVTYNGNGNGSGSAPTDSSSPYNSGSTVTVLGNTGSLARTNYTFAGWNTAADGSGTSYGSGNTFAISANTTLYAQWTANYQYRTINHLSYDPASYTDAEIAAATTKKVYFEHASTGQDIFGNSTTDSSAGLNYDGSADCGLKLLYALNNRYLCNRDHAESENDYTWFSTHSGLQTNRRGNPTPANKIGEFVAMSANMRSAIEIAMWKYCWIDVWESTSGYISDGAAAAASDIEDIEAFEAANAGITVVWWTIPLQSNASYAAREAYNSAIRTYCLDHGKWLIDIAAIECHNDSGVKQTDGNGREIAESSYVITDGGHLSSAGRLKMAKAYWSLIAAIAKDNPTTYTLSGTTRDKSGTAIGGVTVSLFKHTGSGVFSYVNTATSDNSTGAFSFSLSDNDSAYMLTAFKADSPHIYDVSDYNEYPGGTSVSLYLRSLEDKTSTGSGTGDATLANQIIMINHLIDIKGATFSGATDSLDAIRDRGDAAWITGSGLSGSNAAVITIQDEDDANIVEASVEIWDSAGTTFYERKTTNSSGQASFNMDDGTYTVKIHKAGYSIADQTLVVPDTLAPVYAMTAFVMGTPTDPNLCRIYIDIANVDGTIPATLIRSIEVISLPAEIDSKYLTDTNKDGVYNATTGRLYFDAVREAIVRIKVEVCNIDQTGEVPDKAEASLSEVVFT